MLASGQTILASPPFVIDVAGATELAAYGSVMSAGGIDERAMQAGGLQNLTIELVGDTFGTYASAGVLQGLVSAQDEAHGWASVFQPSFTLHHFVLLANNTLALYFRPVPSYDVTAPETVAIEVPGSAVSSGQVPPTVPSFTIIASEGTAAISSDGAAYGDVQLTVPDELALVGPHTQRIVIQLFGNTFREDVGRDKVQARGGSRRSLMALPMRPDGPSMSGG